MRISSAHNPAVRLVRSLDRVTARRETGLYIVEGVRLVSEAVTAGQSATLVLYDPDQLSGTASGSQLLERLPDWAVRSHEVTPSVMAAAAQTETPAGVIAALQLPRPEPLCSHAGDSIGLILDRVGDPGNLGTILRTADALGVGYVATLPGTADLFSPKVVRAGMGAHFHIDLYQHIGWDEVTRQLKNISVFAATAKAGSSLPDLQWPDRFALVIGSESHGLSEELETAVDGHVRIPMRPGIESLNAAIAASIIMYAAQVASGRLVD